MKKLYGTLIGIAFFTVFGIVTSLIPNPFFSRMTPANFLDYFFLVGTSILLGIFFCIPNPDTKSTCSAGSGGIFGFLGFGCALCNKILILLFGFIGVITYIEPFRPLFGGAGLGLLGLAVHKKLRFANN